MAGKAASKAGTRSRSAPDRPSPKKAQKPGTRSQAAKADSTRKRRTDQKRRDPAGGESAATGRPKVYGEDHKRLILVGLMNGRSLYDICAPDDMPGRDWVYEQVLNDKDFADYYARARTIGLDRIADDAISISDGQEYKARIAELEHDLLELKIEIEITKRSMEDGDEKDKAMAPLIAKAELMFVELETTRMMPAAMANRDRLRVDTRKWFLSKLNPAKYGDRLTQLPGAGLGDMVVRNVAVIPGKVKGDGEWSKLLETGGAVDAEIVEDKSGS